MGRYLDRALLPHIRDHMVQEILQTQAAPMLVVPFVAFAAHGNGALCERIHQMAAQNCHEK